MSGIVVPVLEYQEFNLGFLNNSSQEIILANAIPIAPYTVIGLTARVHSVTMASTATFQFIVRAVNPSPSDGRDFVGSDLGSTTAANITNTTQAGTLVTLTTVITNPQSPYARVVLRGNNTATGNCYAILSADLVLKTG